MSKRIWLNNGWEFTEHCTYAFLDGTEECGCTVRLPHTCREVPYNCFDEGIYQMDCAYRRRLDTTGMASGSRVFFTVEAAGHHAEVYLNGTLIAEHNCGYTSFTAELTNALDLGKENETAEASGSHILAVRVDSRETLNIPPFGYVIDYMTFGGLYREAWIDVTDSWRIADVCVRTEPLVRVNTADGSTFTGNVSIETSIDGPGFTSRAPQRLSEPFFVRNRIFSRSDGKNAQIADQFVAAGHSPVTGTLTAEGAELWDIEKPVLYTAVTELLHEGKVIDRTETVFGFRETEWKTDGFYLNGRRVQLTGLNRHQSFPYVGYAMPESMQRRDADILKYELGLNAVRTSHYPQSRHFIDRCDEIGLLVFTEIPGWQHLGEDAWKEQVVENTREMVLQYRNHPSIILWGVRVNESQDDDALYTRTNAAAHELDPTRATGGVRYLKKSSLLEDVYTYNDFLHSGSNAGCEKKKNVTPDMTKPYLISEYNGHMYPTAAFFSEGSVQEQAIRHANVLEAVRAEGDIAGAFGWCFADYNTHRDFGSGDRICYHGVCDMFRNPKPAAAVYAAQSPVRMDAATGKPDPASAVLEVTSGMNIGERPAGIPGKIWIITNADSVRMYKNGEFIREYTHADSPYRRLSGGPILIDDYVGDRMIGGEGYTKEQSDAAKYILNHAAVYGMDKFPPKVMAKAAKLMLKYHMDFSDAYRLYGKYIGNWGESSTAYRFEAVVDGEVVKTLVKAPADVLSIRAEADRTDLVEGRTYDVCAVRLTAQDANGNVMPYFNGTVTLETEGPLEIVGPKTAVLRGGRGGTYLRTTGEAGEAVLTVKSDQTDDSVIRFRIAKEA